MKHWSFDVFKGPEDMPELRVEHGGIPMKLAPQQVSAMLLRSIKQCAEDFLDEEVAQAVITVPTYFTDSQRAATKDAGEDFNNCLVEHLLQVRSRGGEAATRPPSPQPMQS